MVLAITLNQRAKRQKEPKLAQEQIEKLIGQLLFFIDRHCSRW